MARHQGGRLLAALSAREGKRYGIQDGEVGTFDEAGQFNPATGKLRTLAGVAEYLRAEPKPKKTAKKAARK